MEMSPNQVRTATFASARKGFDTDEVTAFLERAAEALEKAQNHANAMEARARAAVARLQELNTAGAARPSEGRDAVQVDESQAETISRTLLLAQKAADEAVAEARAEAERIIAAAREDAQQVGAEERDRLRAEVDALAARRSFLQSDVEQLESFLVDQRERLRAAAATLVQTAERVPDGLGHVRPPLLSASDDVDEDEGHDAGHEVPTRALEGVVSSLPSEESEEDDTFGAAAHDDPAAPDAGHEPGDTSADDERVHDGDDDAAGDGGGHPGAPEPLPVIVLGNDDPTPDRGRPSGR